MKDYVGRNAVGYLVRDQLRNGCKVLQTEEGYHIFERRNNGEVERARIMPNSDGIPDLSFLSLDEEIPPLVRRGLPD